MLTDSIARQILKTYEEAWTMQDTKKILSIFHKDGIYHERILQNPYEGEKEIKNYWNSKVCKEQSNIEFKLLNYYICKNTLIAEWEASFDSNIENARIHIKEVAIMKISKGKIKSLREYWQSEKKNLK